MPCSTAQAASFAPASLDRSTRPTCREWYRRNGCDEVRDLFQPQEAGAVCLSHLGLLLFAGHIDNPDIRAHGGQLFNDSLIAPLDVAGRVR